MPKLIQIEWSKLFFKDALHYLEIPVTSEQIISALINNVHVQLSNFIWYFRKSVAGQMTKYKTHSFGHNEKTNTTKRLVESSTSLNILVNRNVESLCTQYTIHTDWGRFTSGNWYRLSYIKFYLLPELAGNRDVYK